jgi:hypothetical protein
MTDKHSLLHSQRRTFTPYVMIWTLLASLSLAYLVILFTQPGSVSKFMGGSPGVPEEEMRAIAAAAAEVPFLRQSIQQARSEIDDLKEESASQTARDRELMSRIAALEARPQEAAKAPEAAPAGTSAVARALADKRAERQQAATKPSDRLPQAGKDEPRANTALTGTDDLPGAASKTPPPAAAKTAAKKPAPRPADDVPEIGLVTGSVNDGAPAPPVTFGPAVVTPAKTYGLQIGTGPSVDALRTQWSTLAIIHSGSLGPFQPRYVAGADPAAGAYDLVVGPVASAGEAKRLCSELTLKGTPCKVGDYVGNAF